MNDLLLLPPINYLEPKDLTSPLLGTQLKKDNKKITQGFCLVHSNGPACKKLIPVYQKFANENMKNKNKNINCYAIQADSKDWKGSSKLKLIVKLLLDPIDPPYFLIINRHGVFQSLPSIGSGDDDDDDDDKKDETVESLHKIEKTLTSLKYDYFEKLKK